MYCINAIDAAKATLRAIQPGPKRAKEATPIVAHPMCARNMLYFLAAGVFGAANSTAHTAPKGAIVKVSPMGSISLSSADIMAIATNAPEEGQTMSLRGRRGVGSDAGEVAAAEAKMVVEAEAVERRQELCL